MIKKSDGTWKLFTKDGKNKLTEGSLKHVMHENEEMKGKSKKVSKKSKSY